MLFCIFSINWLSAIAVGLSVFALSRFIEALGRSLAVVELAGFIACLQWLVGPLVAYYLGDPHYKYRMYVDEWSYMSFVVPAVLAYLFGLYRWRIHVSFTELSQKLISVLNRRRSYSLFMVTIGMVSESVIQISPPGLLFVVYLAVQLKYIGVMSMLAAKDKYAWVAFFVVWFQSLVESAQSGMFHVLIIWSAMFISFFMLNHNLRALPRYGIVLVTFILLVYFQSVKSSYREQTWQYDDGRQSVGLLLNTFSTTLSNESKKPFLDYLVQVNHRFNQGWITSRVLFYVPFEKGYIYGAGILESVRDSLMLRLISDKKVVAPRDRFIEYTGLEIGKTTSMNISLLGESYINFGRYGGVLFMFFWGSVIALVAKAMQEKSIKHPSLFLFVPLVFLVPIKAEAGFLQIINHLVKSLIFIFCYFSYIKIFTRWRGG